MGNHKFRFSDMMPNAWFYKLKDMSKPASAASHYSNHIKKKDNEKKKHKLQQNHEHQKSPGSTLQKPRQTPSRKSYHFTRTYSTPNHEQYPNSFSHSKSSSIDSLFPDPKYPYGADSVVWAERLDLVPPPTPSPVERELRSDRALPTESFEEKVSWSSSSNYEPRNIIINIDETKQLAAKIENSEDFVTICDLELRTKPKLTDTRKVKSHRTPQSQNKNSETERRQSVSKGIKMRKANSPRISNARIKSVSSSTSSSSSKKSVLAESLAIMKMSENPKEDFKQSMMEMIVELEIRRSKDLEELLACYLSLNSEEYHDLIISVFKQIWIQLSNIESRKRLPTALLKK